MNQSICIHQNNLESTNIGNSKSYISQYTLFVQHPPCRKLNLENNDLAVLAKTVEPNSAIISLKDNDQM